MSFSSVSKAEMCNMEYNSVCCKMAELYGMLLFGNVFRPSKIRISSENQCVISHIATRLYELIKIKTTVVQKEGIKRKNSNFSILIENKPDLERIFNALPHSARSGISVRIDFDFIKKPCCRQAFLRGAFLTGGTVIDPEKGYHLEFHTSHFLLSHDLISLLESFDLSPKKAVRKSNHVVYFKESENIEDILNIMGTTNSALTIMGIKVMRDVRNNINRRVNCETANISKTVEASQVQLEAIEKIVSKKGLESLPETLRTIAKLRLENPELSLGELGEKLNPQISRSGVNHRLKRILEIAKEL